METRAKQAFIQSVAFQNQVNAEGAQILWSRHATTELANEHWSRAAVEVALQMGEVIEDYPDAHRPLPDCLVLGTLLSGEPFHVVVALDELNERLLMVTVYRPDPEEWENDWRTRKS